MKLIAFTLGAAVVSAVAVYVVRRLLVHWQVLDLPNERSSHVIPTPRGGGMGIMATIVLGEIFLAERGGGATGWIVLLATAMLSVVSFIDDRRSLSWRVRFGAQLLGALLVAGVLLATGGGLSWPAAVAVALASAFVFCGAANAYNFMDGINGLAGSQVLMTGVGTALVALAAGAPAHHPAVRLSLLVAGGAAGFLPYNFPRARIFMGDSGSVPLGFLLTVLACWIARDFGWALVIPLGLLHANFALDTGITLVRRWRRGDVLHEAHREHFYQRLTRGGWSHAKVTLSEDALQIVVLAMVLLTIYRGVPWWIVVVPVVALWVGFFIVCERIFLRQSPPRATMVQTPG